VGVMVVALLDQQWQAEVRGHAGERVRVLSCANECELSPACLSHLWVSAI